jgi:TonB family protein
MRSLMMTKPVAGLLAYIISSTLLAETPAFISNAVDANGVRHAAREYHGKKPQWVIDAVHVVRPDYPSWNERRGHQGLGVFRVVIDPATGAARAVTIVRSTGHVDLDRKSLLALRQWRWKPGTWSQVDVPVVFVVGGLVYFPSEADPFPNR